MQVALQIKPSITQMIMEQLVIPLQVAHTLTLSALRLSYYHNMYVKALPIKFILQNTAPPPFLRLEHLDKFNLLE